VGAWVWVCGCGQAISVCLYHAGVFRLVYFSLAFFCYLVELSLV
jgi:hypothetical protein